ncbi:hypothetical protein [Paraburkholderia sediminicola]|uniref:hypothetical protein n=1 Tax=Paraburkholderia sediminicola TaxID=458836 RepID=UPI0038B6BA5C
MQVEMLQLFRVRSSWFEVERIFEHAARDVETLKSVDDANLKDDAVTIVRHRCPNERMATHGAPVDHVGSKIRQFMFAHVSVRRIFSKL